MKAELFYLIGKPNRIKQVFVSELKDRLKNEASIIVPEIITTNEDLKEDKNYKWLDERDFILRQSMGMYCLNWQKNNQYYGVVADIVQRLNMGVDVVINGSLHNLEQATHHFPNLNSIIIQKQGCRKSKRFNDDAKQYMIAEDENVKLEWSEGDSDMGHPYVLSLLSENDVLKAVSMLINLINYEKHALDEVI